jgi:hypothetical protein
MAWDLTCYTISLYRGLNLSWINGPLDYTHTHRYTGKVKLVKGCTLQAAYHVPNVGTGGGKEQKMKMKGEHTEICNVPLMS